MIKKSIFLLFTVLFLFSCNSKHYFEDYVDVPNYIWNETQIVKFSVPVTDTSSLYNISINIRHGFYYNNKNLWLFIKTTSPSGKTQIDTLNCILTDTDNSWKGDCLGDMCDYLAPFVDSVSLKEKGNYIFEIQHGMRQEQVPAIVEIGLIIDQFSINEK